MAFPKRLLNSFETVRVDLRPHWWFLAPPGAATVAALVFTIYALTLDGGAGKAVKIIALIILVIIGGWMLRRYASWYSSHFVVTSHRVIYRAGVLRKTGMQIPLERVNNVNFNQTVFERMLGAGDLLIESGGEGGQERFTDIPHADRVANLIHEAIEDGKHRDRTGAAHGAPVGDVTEQLERLEGLRDRGAITQDEYDAQKRKLLG
jgi:uncharacterized membrane protein YdbT with pleckstrin-like domain